jgi:hypothetical protein
MTSPGSPREVLLFPVPHNARLVRLMNEGGALDGQGRVASGRRRITDGQEGFGYSVLSDSSSVRAEVRREMLSQAAITIITAVVRPPVISRSV